MKKSVMLVSVLAALGSGAALAQQTEGNWMVRVRAVEIEPVKDSNAIAALALPADAVYVHEKLIPEVDFTYFFTKNIAAELVLTYPQELDVKVKGLGKVGKVDALPPTLSIQYHFTPDADFRPYVGAGINYTRFSSVSLPVVNAATNANSTLSKSSVGGSLQIGFDYKIAQNVFINVDIKKVYMDTDLKVGGTKVSTVTTDPVLVGIGVGMRF
ncbi:MAG: OmpW family protein [Betaproteobacteria bacterium]|nr:OmpW family protein [Betaproteobacteria bacterium]